MLIRCRSNIALAAILVVALGFPALAQDRPAEERPEPPLSLLLDQNRATRAGRLMPGLEHKLVAVPAFGLKIHAFVFDERAFDLRTAEQSDTAGNTIADFLDGPEDVFAIDGGFFERAEDGRLSPSGLLVIDGRRVADHDPRAGSGVLHAGGGDAAISYGNAAPPPEAVDSAVQVGPILVDPGGKVGIYSNQGDRRRRSAICLRPGEIVAVVVDGDGLSLYQLAHMLAIPEDEGGVGCDVAINLDGGPSTQAVYRDGARQIDIPGDSTIQNAIVIAKTR